MVQEQQRHPGLLELLGLRGAPSVSGSRLRRRRRGEQVPEVLLGPEHQLVDHRFGQAAPGLLQEPVPQHRALGPGQALGAHGDARQAGGVAGRQVEHQLQRGVGPRRAFGRGEDAAHSALGL